MSMRAARLSGIAIDRQYCQSGESTRSVAQ